MLRTKEYQNVSGHTKVIDTHFDYDHRGRLLSVKQGVDNKTPHTLASMTYNEIGQLSKKTLHGNSSFDMNLYYQDAKII